MRSDLKLGRKPARHTRRTFLSGLAIARRLDELGPPPPKSDDWTQAVAVQAPQGWGLMGNDRWGCCVEADEGHSLMLRTANAGTILQPTDDDVLRLYAALTGFDPSRTDAQGNNPTDQGTDETAACEFMEGTGFLGHRARATAAIDVLNPDHVRWAVQLFGSLRTGFQVPDYAMDQFDRGDPWDVRSGTPNIVGGHDVPFVKYDEGLYYCVTWGKLQGVTPAFVSTFFDEAHAQLFDDWMKQGGLAPSGFDSGRLLEDLDDIRQAT